MKDGKIRKINYVFRVINLDSEAKVKEVTMESFMTAVPLSTDGNGRHRRRLNSFTTSPAYISLHCTNQRAYDG